jgi:hypothetical protein
MTYQKRGETLGKLVESKQIQYGDSAGRAGQIVRILWPNGIPAYAYNDALLVVRVLDKLSRIAQRGPDGKDKGGESPWRDIAGYGLLGEAMDERFSEEVKDHFVKAQLGGNPDIRSWEDR